MHVPCTNLLGQYAHYYILILVLIVLSTYNRNRCSTLCRVELFTKIEYTQSSVLSAIVKICLKSFEEFVRLETFSRSGFQQIQLDTQYLRGPLREYMDDETVVDTLLDEVCAAAAERCLDPTPLEPSVIDRIVAAKRSKQAP